MEEHYDGASEEPSSPSFTNAIRVFTQYQPRWLDGYTTGAWVRPFGQATCVFEPSIQHTLGVQDNLQVSGSTHRRASKNLSERPQVWTDWQTCTDDGLHLSCPNAITQKIRTPKSYSRLHIPSPRGIRVAIQAGTASCRERPQVVYEWVETSSHACTIKVRWCSHLVHWPRRLIRCCVLVGCWRRTRVRAKRCLSSLSFPSFHQLSPDDSLPPCALQTNQHARLLHYRHQGRACSLVQGLRPLKVLLHADQQSDPGSSHRGAFIITGVLQGQLRPQVDLC